MSALWMISFWRVMQVRSLLMKYIGIMAFCGTYYIIMRAPPAPKNKLIVVLDASARFDGVSLNDRFLSGPDLSSSLIGTHVRFRQGRVAFMADLDCMFTKSVSRFSREISGFCDGLKVMWARITFSVGCMPIPLVPQVLLQLQSMHGEKELWIMQRTAVQRHWWL